MKSTLALLALGLLVSCGKHTKQTKYIENPYDNSGNEAKLAELEQRLQTLEQSFALKVVEIDSVQAEIDANESDSSALQSILGVLEAQIDHIQLQITELSTNENVVAFIDPCGNGAGYDEVLLKTSSGKVVAYFEQGNYRHLSILEVGVNYRTTDQQACNFKVKADGTLEY